MRKRLSLLFILLLTPFLVQCASNEEIQVINYKLHALNQKVEDMKANTVGEMRKRQADSSGQLDELHQELLAVKSQLEETAHLNRRLQEQNKELENNYSSLIKNQNDQFEVKFATLSDELNLQKNQVKTLQVARVQESRRKADKAAKAAEEARQKAQLASARSAGSNAIYLKADKHKVLYNTSTRASQTKPQPAATPDAATVPVSPPATPAPLSDYQSQGQAKYNGGKYDQAFKLFQKYIDKNGSGSKTLSARYMMGECLYQQGAYDQAILQYHKRAASAGGQAMTSKALFRQAMSFEQLSDNETAKIIYRKIASSYGSSPEAKKAKKKLSQL